MIERRGRRRRAEGASEGDWPRPSPFAPRPSPGGFTLVELLVVIVIISILLSLILNAAMSSVQRAQERATQALITKLETGLNDRLDALMQTRPDPNTAHLVMARIYNSSGHTTNKMEGPQRAQVIAWYDYIKREMPDTFFVQNASPTATQGVYPLNFAGPQYPEPGGTATDPAGLGLYILPLGHSIQAPYGDGSGNAAYSPSLTNNTGLMEYNPAGEGIYGASYPVAAGIYKNLGYLPQGYDGIDNDHNSTIDDAAKGIGQDPSVPSPDNPRAQIPLSQLIQARLNNHKHITARAEMLYALLVEGRGPLGSVFNADDFTDKEVQDTDGDGLPEFVDAWGNPLQFFRWPLLYHSEVQRGQVVAANNEKSWSLAPPYQNMFEQREQDPLDMNQQLVAPAWWSASYNNASICAPYSSGDTQLGVSGPAEWFEYYFHRLTDPLPKAGGQYYWDRGTTYGQRRAYFTKFLIVSGGLDGQLGVFIYSDALLGAHPRPARALLANENNAMPFSVADVDFTKTAGYSNITFLYTDSLDPTTPTTGDLMQAAQDDISNQNIQMTVGIGGGG